MHTITILQGHSDHKQTSFRASRLFEDGLLKIAAQNIGHFFQKGKTCAAMLFIVSLGHLEEAGNSITFFMQKYIYISLENWVVNSKSKSKSIFSLVIGQPDNTWKYGSQFAHGNVFVIEILFWGVILFLYQTFWSKNTLWRCSRHTHQGAKLQLLTWASTAFWQVSRNSFPIWELRRGCSWDPSTF